MNSYSGGRTMELKINNLIKEYSKKEYGLKDYSLIVNEDITGLLAQNGADKTALLKTLATVMRLTKCKGYDNGIDIFEVGSDYINITGY